jgi:hypothetical protein
MSTKGPAAPHSRSYFVIGERADGVHAVVSGHETHEGAQRVMRLIRHGPDWRRFHILVNKDALAVPVSQDPSSGT